MTGTGTGLAGWTNGTRDIVLNIASETHNQSRPRPPLPRWLMTDAALVMRENLIPWSVSKEGWPTMGVMVGCGKLSIIVSVNVMVGFCQSLAWQPRSRRSGGGGPTTLAL